MLRIFGDGIIRAFDAISEVNKTNNDINNPIVYKQIGREGEFNFETEGRALQKH